MKVAMGVVAVLLSLVMASTLLVSRREAEIASERYRQARDAGREGGAAGYLVARAVHQGTAAQALMVGTSALLVTLGLVAIQQQIKKTQKDENGPN